MGAVRIGLGLFALGLGLMGGAASAPAATLDYRIYVAGLRVVDAQVSFDVTSTRYRLSATSRTSGLAGFVASYESSNLAIGRVEQGRVVPEQFQQFGLLAGEQRNVRFTYDTQGRFLERLVDPPPESENREPIPEELTEGAVDMATALVAQLVAAGQTGSCQSRQAVFDGRRRFDMVFKDDGAEQLTGSQYAPFIGPVTKCALTIEILAGTLRKSHRALFAQSKPGDPPVPIAMWVAPVGPDRVPVPVRVQSRSLYGPVMVHLVAVDGVAPTPAAALGVSVPVQPTTVVPDSASPLQLQDKAATP